MENNRQFKFGNTEMLFIDGTSIVVKRDGRDVFSDSGLYIGEDKLANAEHAVYDETNVSATLVLCYSLGCTKAERELELSGNEITITDIWQSTAAVDIRQNYVMPGGFRPKSNVWNGESMRTFSASLETLGIRVDSYSFTNELEFALRAPYDDFMLDIKPSASAYGQITTKIVFGEKIDFYNLPLNHTLTEPRAINAEKDESGVPYNEKYGMRIEAELNGDTITARLFAEKDLDKMKVNWYLRNFASEDLTKTGYHAQKEWSFKISENGRYWVRVFVMHDGVAIVKYSTQIFDYTCTPKLLHPERMPFYKSEVDE